MRTQLTAQTLHSRSVVRRSCLHWNEVFFAHQKDDPFSGCESNYV